MKFTKIIESTCEVRAMDGFAFTGEIEFNEEGKKEFIKLKSENEWWDAVDDFRDGWDDLCEGEDGKLYMVKKDVNSHLILMWQEVVSK